MHAPDITGSPRLTGAAARTFVAVLAASCASIAIAQDRFIEDVLVSRGGDAATIDVRLGCPMRYVAEVPGDAGVLLEVRMAPFDECRAIGSGIVSELQRPVGGRLAGLTEIEYESLGIGDGLLMLRFDRPVAVRVTQRGNLRTLQVVVELDAAGAMTEIAPTPAIPPGSSVPPSAEAAASADAARERRQSASTGRAPLTGRVVEPQGAHDYMINLLSTRDSAELDSPPMATAAAQTVYVSTVEVDGIVWHRLRIGFYASEAEAAAELESLVGRFPRAWIGRAEHDEIAYAASAGIAGDRALPVFTAEAQVVPTDVAAGTEPLAPERVAELLETGRQALLDEDYARAITAYTLLLGTAGDHRAAAREYLGLALERVGDVPRARAEYQRYLDDYPDGDGAARVRQRLTGLLLRDAEPKEQLRATLDDTPRWELNTGMAQYYRRDDNRFDADQPETTTLSAVFTDLDFHIGRAGDRIDYSTRISLSHMNDLLDADEGGRGDQQRVSYAYADFGASDGTWSTRLGRQSLHTWGVLGRFDGAHVSWGWAPDRELHVTYGHPVESTRDSIETDRQFYGVAVEFGELIGEWDVAAFFNTQTIDGMDARSAVGTEVRYFDERRSFTGMVDYDVDFDALNTLLMLGTWRFDNRLTLSVLYDERMSPILTTRNALIGQPVATVDELLLVWTEDEIRQLAVDRTAESRTVTIGLAKPLADRFQLNFDLTRAEYGGTVESAGVAAVPDQGAQTFASTSLVGSGLFRGGDVNILNLRVGQSDAFRSQLLTWDSRFPIGRRIRINPRVRFSVWEGLLDGRERRSVSPMLRLMMNTRNRYRLELEIGIDRQVREDVTRETEASGRFVNFGYRANF